MKIIQTAMESAKSYPAYLAAKSKLEEIERDLKQAKRDQDTRQCAEPLQAAVKRVLAGGPVETESIDDGEQRRQAAQRVRVLTAAVEEQKRVARNALGVVAAEIGPELRKHHEKIVSRMAKTLREFSAAVAEQEALEIECDRRELGFPNMRPLGGFINARLDVQGSEAAIWIAEAAEYGYSVGA